MKIYTVKFRMSTKTFFYQDKTVQTRDQQVKEDLLLSLPNPFNWCLHVLSTPHSQCKQFTVHNNKNNVIFTYLKKITSNKLYLIL